MFQFHVLVQILLSRLEISSPLSPAVTPTLKLIFTYQTSLLLQRLTGVYSPLFLSPHFFSNSVNEINGGLVSSYSIFPLMFLGCLLTQREAIPPTGWQGESKTAAFSWRQNYQKHKMSTCLFQRKWSELSGTDIWGVETIKATQTTRGVKRSDPSVVCHHRKHILKPFMAHYLDILPHKCLIY